MKLLNFVIALIMFFTPCIAFSQSFYMQNNYEDQKVIGLKSMRPTYENNNLDYSVFTMTHDFYMSMPLSNGFNYIVNIPYTNESMDYGYGKNSEKGVGNIYIGLQMGGSSDNYKSHWFTFGINLPTANNSLPLTSYYGNLVDAKRSWVDCTSISSLYVHERKSTNGTFAKLEIGPELFIASEQDNELFVHLGLSAGVSFESFVFSTEFVGRGIATEDADSFSDRFNNFLSFGFQRNKGMLRPGVFIQLPLDKDIKNVVSNVIGLKLEFVKQ